MQRSEDIAVIRRHYESRWNAEAVVLHHARGPVHELPPEFCVLRFPPRADRSLVTYATCGMSLPGDKARLEVFLLAPSSDDAHCELLTMLAHYHRTLRNFGHSHLIPFGRPWLPESTLDCGVFSLPYLDGPALEWLHTGDEEIRFLWLIPITRAERIYCRENGLEALEVLFESSNFNYADPMRPSVCPPAS